MRPIVAALLLASLIPSTARAQARVEFTPFAAGYFPLTDRIVRTDTVATTTLVTVAQNSGSALGARVAVWTTERFGIEGSVTAVWGDIHVTAEPPAGSNPTGHAKLLVASARALLAIGPRSAIGRFHVLVGIGVVSHGGAWKNNWDGTTDVGAVLGAAGTFPLGAVKLRLGIEQHLFNASFEGSATTGVTPSRLQSDLLLSLGVTLSP